jgi:hypothetical protein
VDTELPGTSVSVSSKINQMRLAPLYLPFVNDYVCITQSLPYYRCMVGSGVEDRSASRLLSCTKSTHL